ncbi:MAG: transposase [Candidatus Manganitrophaceae bacterium]|nr:MAG: transposase [Candidatus Manganitrophaceae bacterium]
MKRRQAFKYELVPTGEQQRQMRRFASSCRFVYNKALALQKTNHDAGGKFIGYVAMAKQLTAWRNNSETGWLADTPAQPLQQALKDLEQAYKNFFAKRADFPRFKKKGRHESFRYPQGCKLDQANNCLFLPKLGWLRYRNSRVVLGAVKNVTVSQSGGKWYVSIQTEREVPEPVHPSRSIVGIDVGVARFATLSDGVVFTPRNSFKRHERALAKVQRAMSRKRKFSNNWKKAKTKVTKLHQKIANVRRDFLHKTSHEICKNHAIIVIEDLQVRNMSKSAAGTKEKPGRNVRAKSGLNKSILDQGWFEFRRQLEYKQAWRGGQVIAVPPQNTSRTCPVCGHIAKENRKDQARFKCVRCGFEGNADVVGAMNILRAGHARLACEVNGAVRPSAAGTHRSDSRGGSIPRLSTVGIPQL